MPGRRDWEGADWGRSDVERGTCSGGEEGSWREVDGVGEGMGIFEEGVCGGGGRRRWGWERKEIS